MMAERKKKTSKAIGEDDIQYSFPPEVIKLHKGEVNYRPSQSANKCRNCKFFLKEGKCRIVAGEIKPEDVCNKYQKSSS